MTSYRTPTCPRCQGELEMDDSAPEDAWFGCSGCGERYCRACSDASTWTCPVCGAALRASTPFPHRLAPESDWRQWADDRNGTNYTELEIRSGVPNVLLAVVPSELPALDEALLPWTRAAFWNGVADCEVWRRLGSLDTLAYVGSTFGWIRLDDDFAHCVRQAASWGFEHARIMSPGVDARELAQGLSLFGNLRDSPGVVELTVSEDEEARSVARYLLSRWPSERRAAVLETLLPNLGRELRSESVDRRWGGLELLGTLSSRDGSWQVDSRRTLPWQLVSEALRRVDDATIATLARQARDKGLLAAAAIILDLSGPILSWVEESLTPGASSNQLRTRQACRYAAALGPLADDLRKRVNALKKEVESGPPHTVPLAPRPQLDAAEVLRRLNDGRHEQPLVRSELIESLSELAATRTGTELVLSLASLFCASKETGASRCDAARGLARVGVPAAMAGRLAACLADPRACVRAWSLLLAPDSAVAENLSRAERDQSTFVRFVVAHLAELRGEVARQRQS